MKKAITIGCIRDFMKDLPDDIPVFIDDENEIMPSLGIEVKNVDFYNAELDRDVNVYCVVLCVS